MFAIIIYHNSFFYLLYDYDNIGFIENGYKIVIWWKICGQNFMLIEKIYCMINYN
jgi:hypothetical protein